MAAISIGSRGSRAACDDAERRPGGIGAELDRRPPERSRITRVIQTFHEDVVGGDFVRGLYRVDDGHKIIEPDRILVEHDDDTSKDRVHLCPMHALDAAHRLLERVNQLLGTRPMHGPRLDVRTTRCGPHVPPAGAIDTIRHDPPRRGGAASGATTRHVPHLQRRRSRFEGR